MQLQTVLYYRDHLSSRDRKLYDSLLDQWMHMRPWIHLAASQKDLARIAMYIRLDLPMLFYVNFLSMEFMCSPLGIRLRGNYYCSKPDAASFLEQAERWAKSVTASMPRGLSRRSQARYLSRYLCRHVRYGIRSEESCYSVVGVIRYGCAVCEGISKAYKLLCDQAGIPCILVSGTHDTSPDVGHSWNKLWLDDPGGKPCYVDITRCVGNPLFAEFQISERDLRAYHWDKTLIPE